MQISRIKISISLIFSIASAVLSPAFSNTSYRGSDIAEKMYKDLFVDLSDEELEARIMNVTNLFEPKFTSEVKGYLRVYLTSRPEWTQILLGRTSIYFPIFERKIEEKGLPNDLKIVSIIESALRTSARSRVGAQGLWQFMPGTAKMNDLVIDKYVDEREDPYRATDAALEYLTDLYNRYNNWALAIAAYNSGPGRVNQAIAISGSKNFWQLRNYLPRETRNYVPAFLAAAYMLKHFEEYYITPESTRLDFQITKALKIYNEISFQSIADITGISISDIRFLNTSYRKDMIPSNKIGFTLLLPGRVAGKMDNYLHNLDRKANAKQEDKTIEPIDSSMIDQQFYSDVMYSVQPNEKLQDIADFFNVDKYNIRHWNSMKSDDMEESRPLLIHYIKNENKIMVNNNTRKFVKRNKIYFKPLPSKSFKNTKVNYTKALPEFYKTIESNPNSMLNMDLNDQYRLRRGESMQDVLRKHPGMSLEEIQLAVRNTNNPAVNAVISLKS
ncbi:MAG: transglycosylase SLT domain-containing protein [Saprospiraceae bacterium]